MQTIAEILLVAIVIGFFWLVAHFNATAAIVIFILCILWILTGVKKFGELRRKID